MKRRSDATTTRRRHVNRNSSSTENIRGYGDLADTGSAMIRRRCHLGDRA